MAEQINKLKTFKEEDDQSSFNSYVMELFPDIERYIKAHIRRAVQKQTIQKGNIDSIEVMDQLYINAYEHIHSISHSEHFKLWLYKEADRILGDVITEEVFDDFFFKNIENYTEDEWKAMEERYTIDADGDYVMQEDLDDQSYEKKDYQLEDVFIEDENDTLIESIDEHLSQERLNAHIATVLPKLPTITASILELFNDHSLKAHEIAEVKGISIKEVTEYLSEAREMISQTLTHRFKTKTNKI